MSRAIEKATREVAITVMRTVFAVANSAIALSTICRAGPCFLNGRRKRRLAGGKFRRSSKAKDGEGHRDIEAGRDRQADEQRSREIAARIAHLFRQIGDFLEP